jgi:hypothetical protein
MTAEGATQNYICQTIYYGLQLYATTNKAVLVSTACRKRAGIVKLRTRPLAAGGTDKKVALDCKP